MSKLPHKLPISHGTEDPFSQVTRTPPKFTLRGAGVETPEGRAAIDKWGGAARQFYLQQAQNSELSITKFSKVSAELAEGVRVTYTRNFDLEIVELEIQAPSESSEDKHPHKEDNYNWALVEFVIPHDISIDIDNDLAVILKGNLNGAPVWAHSSDTNSSDNILRFADKLASSGPILGDIAENATQLDSLLIDLRPFRSAPVSFDLYGFMFAYNNSDPNTLVLDSITANIRCVLFAKPLDAISVLRTGAPQLEIFYQWESSNTFPTRMKMGDAPVKLTYPGIQVTDWPSTQNVGNHFGGQKLGTLVISSIKSNPGFNFKPA